MTRVLVADRSALFGGDWPHGFTPFSPEQAAAFLREISRISRLEPRPLAESNKAWKQWIPYCLLTCGDHTHADRAAFAVQRTKGQSEGRLHGAWSLGIGGHIEEEDLAAHPRGTVPSHETFHKALERELFEELDLKVQALPTPRLLGLLNDDSTDVGSVHAGLAYHVHLRMPLVGARVAVTVRETAKMHGGFTLLAELPALWQNPHRVETWSQMLLDSRIPELTTP